MLENLAKVKLIKLETVDSTNEYAKKVINDGKINGTVLIISDTQTSGKTTKKTAWYSPAGNLYMSLIIDIDDMGENFLPQLSFITALSLVETIEAVATMPLGIKIKWPNDVLLDGMKLSGILIEKEKHYAIIGIGVNVITHPDRNFTVYPTVALRERGVVIDKDELGIGLASKIATNTKLAIDLGFDFIIGKITPFMLKFMETVEFEQNGTMFHGIFTGINKNGGLCLKLSNGDVKVFYSGNLSVYNKD